MSGSALATRVTSTPAAGGEHQRRDLRDQAVADGEQAVALERADDLHVLLPDADAEAAQDVDQS